ncbi:PhoX family protein [Solirubrobacter phytolaccae]|uniref:PhoX family protein n=1 Tax=Solirubrobacter phytolaccae TaxID=1404360 RepID=A0A9X3SGD5_9ACTN|nr:alkaline phosphatase PhoX [Solirubrobacter phytolaccae]MDA0182342.1 PhoX family protein [Solirubrobacter phytolaccae]
METGFDRRTFLVRTGGGLMSLGALERLVARDARAQEGRGGGAQPYGPLRRTRDQRGVEVLALPAGFTYVTFSHSGSKMADGNPTPLALDGMGSFPGGRRRGHHGTDLVRLVRNSEDRNPAGTVGGLLGDRTKAYDPTGYGGTSTLVYDERRRVLVEDFVSLNGTIVNCAGGISYRGKYWLTGEESVGGPEASDATQRFAKRHGYLFQTPVDRDPGELRPGVPIKAAGRFSHEAAAVDQRTGIVYETEDPGSGVGGGFYRYTPKRPDDLAAGGTLDMLAIQGRPQIDLRQGRRRGERLPVSWVRIEDPDPAVMGIADPRSTFNQGWAKGGAKFNRLEGCWEDDSTIFFVSTSGGDAKNGDVNTDGYAEGFGQVWAYRAEHRGGGTLTLVYESPSGAECDSPDNLTVTPRGGLIACEDDASSALVDTHPLAPGIEHVNRLIGITPRGQAFELAVNVLNGSELAGVSFSPSGRTLFFNLFGRARFDEDPVEGMTCAVTGPWHRGPL